MNFAGVSGRLTRAPETRYGGTENNVAITRFPLAVDDREETDFINIKCLGRLAEWAEKWLRKGSRVEVTGKIKTGSYEKDGRKVYYTEILASTLNFGETKAEAEARQGSQARPEQSSTGDGFVNIPDGLAEELPFN